MLKNAFSILCAATALLCLAQTAQADTFDDAVNIYLKGFEHCTEAKEALSAHNIQKANRELKQYEALKSQAAGINNTILNSSKRGMDSNLKYCQRVANDIEIEMGTPILERAIAACEKAEAELKANNPQQAQTHYNEFLQQKTEALNTAPSLNDVFSARNQIRRCQRLEKKIANFSQKQEALALAIETVLEESETYSDLCQLALKNLTQSPMSKKSLKQAEQGLSGAKTRRNNALSETLAIREIEKSPSSPEKKNLDKHLAAGNQCVTNLSNAIQEKQAELTSVENELSEYNASLSKANTQCQSIQSQAITSTSQKTYETAKKQYDSAIKARNDVRAALAKNEHYNSHTDWSNVQGINRNMKKLNTCLDQSRTHLSALFNAIPVTKPAIPSVAATTQPDQDKPLSGVPPKKISASIKMLNGAPEFVIAYMVDGSQPEQGIEINIDASGFNEPVYFVGSGDTFRLKSKDFATHRISVAIDNLNFSTVVARVQSRQTRSGRVTWPVNTLATLRSDRGNVVPSYIAHVPSAHHKLFMFDFGVNSLHFELENPSEAAKGFLLLPNFDPVEIDINQGQIKSIAITRDHEPLGSVLLKGL